jgi:hypothetical protein
MFNLVIVENLKCKKKRSSIKNRKLQLTQAIKTINNYNSHVDLGAVNGKYYEMDITLNIFEAVKRNWKQNDT